MKLEEKSRGKFLKRVLVFSFFYDKLSLTKHESVFILEYFCKEEFYGKGKKEKIRKKRD